MAGDTRESTPPDPRGPSPGETEPQETTRTPSKNYEVFQSPPASANALPAGSGQNTAGSKLTSNPTFTDALKTVRLQDFTQVHMYPCVRESLLMGIGAGFGIGSVRGIFGAPIPKAANWAVGSFMLFSIANYEYCLYMRQWEKANMKRAVDIMARKKNEKEEAARIKREERRRIKEEADRKEEEEKRKKSWRFW